MAEAAEGLTALQVAKSERPDVAIIDHSMAGMNGTELAQSLRKAVPEIEVIVFTAHERENVILDAFRVGARAYVHKSDHDGLLAAIEEMRAHRTYFSPCVAELMLSSFARSNVPPLEGGLTRRERLIVEHVAAGKPNREIASVLGTSVRTIESRRKAAMAKLNLRTTADLVRLAVRKVLVAA